MSLPAHLEALKDEALRISCISWALQKRWPIAKTGIDRAGPCPDCGGTDRFSIHTTKNTFNCRRCGIKGHGVIDLVVATEHVEFTRACEIITGRSASEPVDEARAERIRRDNEEAAAQRAKTERDFREQARERGFKIWRRGAPGATGAWVPRYLDRRGIDLDIFDPPIRAALQLREIAEHPWTEMQGNVRVTVHAGPAMLAAVQRPDGRFGAIHQTWLDLDRPKGKLVLPTAEDGSERASKKVMGVKRGGAIRLYTPEGARRMVMGEGIETTLTAMRHNFEPDTAYWAGVDLGNMAGRDARDPDGAHLWDQPDLDDRDCFIPPDWCRELVYLCDSDDPRNHTEEKIIRGLRRALMLRDRQRADDAELPPLLVSYVPPLGDGLDLNDLVRVASPP